MNTSLNIADEYEKQTIQEILEKGTLDENPRPHYEDEILPDKVEEAFQNLTPGQWIEHRGDKSVLCTPAHTLSINGHTQTYDLSKGEFPIQTLRPQAIKNAVNEILWIYQMQSNKLEDLHNMGITYWDDWNIGDNTIGCRYGATVKRWDLMNKLLKDLTENPFGRRHIINLWQEADFKDETGGTTKGLNPCCYETIWNVRRGKDNKLYLDMTMNQRSSDYIVSNFINEIQYVALQLMVAKHCNMEPGVFIHVSENVQIYNRHIEQAKEMLMNRSTIVNSVNPRLILDTDKTNFYDFTWEDFKVIGLDRQSIKEQNPQMEFDLAI